MALLRILGLLLLIVKSFTLYAQDIYIYKGDSVKLNLMSYRGQIQWEVRTPPSTTWSSIPGATTNNYWVKPTVQSMYRALVTEGSCYPPVYSNIPGSVYINSTPGIVAGYKSVSSITHSTFVLSAEIRRIGGSAVAAEKGVCWATHALPTLADNSQSTGSGGNGPYLVTATGLTENTTYHARPYFKLSDGTVYYGSVGPPFKTLVRITVERDMNPVVGVTTASFNLSYLFNGSSAPVSAVGVCYRKLNDYYSDDRLPSISDLKTVQNSSAASFSTTAAGLVNGTEYIYRAYVTTTDGVTYYSFGGTFQTKHVLTPFIGGIKSLESNSASLEYGCKGVGTVTEIGFCYGIGPNPTVANFKTNRIGVMTDPDINLAGGLTLNPNTKYYARAYAILSTGSVAYGNEISFTSLPLNSPTLTVSVSGAAQEDLKVMILGSVSGTATVVSKGICYYKQENRANIFPTIADIKTNEGGGILPFLSTLSGLQDGLYYQSAMYKYRAYATLSNGTTVYSNVKIFNIYDLIDTEVIINSVSDLRYDNVKVNYSVNLTEGTGRGAVTLQGICYSTSPNPDFNDTRSPNPPTGGTIVNKITGLSPNTKYYARAYAEINAYGSAYMIYYSDEVCFTTPPPPASAVTTMVASNVTRESVGLLGLVNGGDVFSERGFCYHTAPNVTVANSKIKEGSGTGYYSLTLNGLSSGITYYVKAYAITNTGTTIYGREISFTTQSSLMINTINASGVTSTSVTTGGELDVVGSLVITAKGVCYGTTQNPTLTGAKTNNGSGLENFGATLTGLSSNTLYYARAYVTDNTGKTYYGNQIAFTTTAPKTFDVTTTNGFVSMFITSYSVSTGGNVSGTGTISARGVCWGTTENPTIAGSKTSNGTGFGSFTAIISNLLPGTTYYYRAYATSGGLTNYGEQYTLYYANSITTNPVSNILATSAISGGTVPDALSGTITAKGLCWSLTENPTISNSKTNDGSGPGSFSSSLTGLTVNNTYYVRAYATLSTGLTYYGNQVRFTTGQNGFFTITTQGATNITEVNAEIGGKVVGVGTIVNRGICYGTSPSPTVANNTIIVQTWNGENFTGRATGLNANNTYYARAFITLGSNVVQYGNEVSFVTAQPASYVVTTLPVTNIEAFEVQGGGSYTGVGSIFDYGVVCSTSPNPVAFSSSSLTNQMWYKYSPLSISNPFRGSIQTFNPATIHYARAYLRSESGQIFYGNQVTFTSGKVNVETGQPIPKGVSATFGGRLYLYGDGTVLEKGFCWSTSPNPTTVNFKISQGTAAGYYMAEIIGLKISTTYYVRAYAVKTNGETIYGIEKKFVTLDHESIRVYTKGAFDLTSSSVILTGEIENNGSGTITSRGICWGTDPIPTTASNKTLEGSGNGTFSSSLTGLSSSTVYYWRAYGITNTGKTLYGDIHFFSTRYYTPPLPIEDPISDITPPSGGGGGTPGVGDRYLVFGKVYGPATINCNEGSHTFTDYKLYATKIVEGKFSYSSYQQASSSLLSFMKSSASGQNYSYMVESSADYSLNYRYAVIIEFTKDIPAWDCFSTHVTIGFGNSYAEALSHAIDKKNREPNGGRNAPFQELKSIHW